jgi:hypothetical protein
MECLFAIVAALSPRLALVLVLVLHQPGRPSLRRLLLPLLGLVFLPFTPLFYVLVDRPVAGLSGWGWFFVFLGLLFDLGSMAAARSRRR